MTRFTPRLNILPAPQIALWPELAPGRKSGLVLYGGTAVALRLGHRQSVDFDFFTDKSLDKDYLRNIFPFLGSATTLQDAENTLTVSVDLGQGPVKVSFFGGIACGRIKDPEQTEDGVLLVASLPDLLAHKLKVILQRPAAKDYRDIAALLDHGLNLAQGLAGARAMWPTLQPAVALKALTFFGDGDLDTLADADRDILVELAASAGDLPEVSLKGSTLAPAEY